MIETYEEPVFNTKAAAEETGVTPETLRAWERRYGLPQPARTEAGHRVYSQRDIDIIKWLVARQEEGLRIGRAVKLWRSLREQGREPLRAMAPPSARATAPTGNTIAEMRQAWVSACLAFDEGQADQVITQAFALYPPELVVLKIIRQGVAQIGEGWCEGDVTVQQEHFASELAVRQLESLTNAAPPPTRAGRILVACPPEEEHMLGLLILTFLLRRAGWDIVYLGANVPMEKMKSTIEATKPRLVILAAQQLHTAASLLRMAQFLKQEGAPLAFGGGIFNRLPNLSSRIPGHLLGSSLEEATSAVEQVMKGAYEASSIKPLDQAQEDALSHYTGRRLSLEAALERDLEAMGVDRDTLLELNAKFSRAITAALTLGNMSFMDSYVDWLEGIDNTICVSTDVLYSYLEAYHRAARAHLDERGAPIINWLEERISAHTGKDSEEAE